MSDYPIAETLLDADPTVRRPVIVALGQKRDSSTQALLQWVAEYDASAELRQLAVDLIGKIKADQPSFVTKITDGGKMSAADFFASLGVPATVSPVPSTHAPKLFLIEPRNEDFARGRDPKPVATRMSLYRWLMIFVFIFAGLGIGAMALLQYNGDAMLRQVALIWNIGIALFLVINVRTAIRNKYLAKVGTLLFGEVTFSRDETNDENGSYSHSVVEFTFTSPLSGQQLHGKQRFQKKLVGLPTPSTPVAVLYADDKRFRVL